MGKLRGLIKGDISRVFGSSTFILAVIATSLIMLTGSIGSVKNHADALILHTAICAAGATK